MHRVPLCSREAGQAPGAREGSHPAAYQPSEEHESQPREGRRFVSFPFGVLWVRTRIPFHFVFWAFSFGAPGSRDCLSHSRFRFILSSSREKLFKVQTPSVSTILFCFRLLPGFFDAVGTYTGPTDKQGEADLGGVCRHFSSDLGGFEDICVAYRCLCMDYRLLTRSLLAKNSTRSLCPSTCK